MKNRLLILFMVVMGVASLPSCHSHRTVARGAHGRVTAVRPSSNGTVELPSHQVVTGSGADSNDAEIVARLIEGARTWLGTPYRYGGTDRDGVDCSGFVQRLFADVAAVSLPRNSARQAEDCRPVARNGLQPGDLVFFNGSRVGGGVGHVGLYVGDQRMIHASTSRGVIVSDINADYYACRYCGGGRVAAITYGARGKKPKGTKAAPQPQQPELPAPVVIPAPASAPVAAAPAPAQPRVVPHAISARVDSAFAVLRMAEPDSICSDWMD
ncbi:MAG: C40 family peptidase [Muribaculaceae bacterium]|nr:C40 family peptidase [Muribaculaceae bacterium]